jgi:hypothetical protein
MYLLECPLKVIGNIRRLSKLTGEDAGKVAEQMALTAQRIHQNSES